MQAVYLGIVLAPLVAAVIAGLLGRQIGRSGAHWVTTLGVAISFVLSLVVLKDVFVDGAEPFDGAVYTWLAVDSLRIEIGFLVDALTAVMISVVSFVSLMVHVYTIGYMHDDPGYQRFFSYISLFTFFMLMLVMANNFLQLFFGWEGVGLMSYLLIGFWYTRESATYASLKAFLVNRVGDLGFLLGIAAILLYTGSLGYAEVFSAAPGLSDETMEIIPGQQWAVMSVICILLFIGAMGKSAQVPLHVWLPDSMEGPTPISALIHAATMVTAGIFMVARMSPLYELSETALSVILVIGAVTAFFMGLVGLVQNDIKRVIAYSTLSQLGYMFVGLGASAYAAGIFHLMTHAFFKALLFLGAGAVIVALHHEQDMRRMGNMRRYLPITHWTMLIGTLALVGAPFFAGFFSKDSIIEAVHLAAESGRAGAGFAFWMVLLGVFVTALYSFRLYFMVFWGEERIDPHAKEHMRHLPRYVLPAMEWPVLLLAIPSVVIGYLTIEPLLFGDAFGGSLVVAEGNDVLRHMGEHFHGPAAYALHAFTNFQVPAFYLALAGFLVAWLLYVRRPDVLPAVRARLAPAATVLERKYWFDELYGSVLAPAGRGLGRLLWQVGDVRIIDGGLVNGSARLVGRLAVLGRRLQTGFLYHYAFTMIIGLSLLLGWLLFLR